MKARTVGIALLIAFLPGASVITIGVIAYRAIRRYRGKRKQDITLEALRVAHVVCDEAQA